MRTERDEARRPAVRQDAARASRAGAPAHAAARVALGLQSTAGNGAVARLMRAIKIKGEKRTESFANLEKFKKSPLYGRVMAAVPEKVRELAEYHLGLMFSSPVTDFESEQHFVEALMYDVENKSPEKGKYTLQELYMTEYGWRKRSTTPGTALPPMAANSQKALKVYRTMPLTEWKAIEKGDYSVLIGGHLGDFKQSHAYLYRKSDAPKVLVEFTLAPGAETVLFSKSTMAFPDVQGRTVPNLIKDTLVKEKRGDTYAVASTNEGTAPGKVGIKSEGGEAGFSLGIGGGGAPDVLKKLVSGTKVLGTSTGKEVMKTGKQEETGKGAGGAEGENKPPSGAQRDGRWQRFLDALQRVPVPPVVRDARVEEHDPANQYVPSGDSSGGPSVARPAAYDGARITVTPNPGGGDCLFHGLHGRTLPDDEMLVQRQLIAAVREGLPENRVLNALNVAAALSQTEDGLEHLLGGRQEIPNDVYALLQAVPGIYAGEDELTQWCIHGNTRVTVIDATLPLAGGALSVYSPTGRQPIPVDERNLYDVARVWAQRTPVVLFKTAGHWERVRSIDG